MRALAALVTLAAAVTAAQGGSTVSVYVGTYTSGGSRGIYRLAFDPATGALTGPGQAVAETVNPSFLAFHPSGRYLYAVNETGDGPADRTGGVSAFAVDPASGALTPIGRQPSGGAAPCHLWITNDGRHVLVANYTSGTVSVLPVGEDGRLGAATALVEHEGHGADPRRQEGPHAHYVRLDPAERFAFVVDLGIDRVIAYRFGAAGTLVRHGETVLRSGAGPRHLAFHPDGRRAYVINELDSTLTAYEYDAEAGTLRPVHTVRTLPTGVSMVNFPAEVVVHPNGRVVYGSNRGHDSIAAFAIPPDTGTLNLLGHEPTRGHWPRNFTIDPTGTWLLAANERSDSVSVFRIDAATGGLTAVGAPVAVPKPVCLRFAPLRR